MIRLMYAGRRNRGLPEGTESGHGADEITTQHTYALPSQELCDVSQAGIYFPLRKCSSFSFKT